MRRPVALPLTVGTWYIDRELGAKFKLLSVETETVTVIDEWGHRRTVNRALWERDMEETTWRPRERNTPAPRSAPRSSRRRTRT